MTWQYPEVAKHHASFASLLENNSNYDIAIVLDMFFTCIPKDGFTRVIQTFNDLADEQGPVLGAQFAYQAHLAEMLKNLAIRSKEVYKIK